MKSPVPVKYRPALHFYAIGLSVATFFLLFAGGMVTSTNSGLAVPDWPNTFGQNMFLYPPSMMKGGIFYEHGHRLFASLVGFLTIGICLAFWILEKRRWLRWTGTLALLLVIGQGVLGGITVLYKLPMPVSAAHACTAELFFAVTLLMAFSTSRAWIRASGAEVRWGSPEQALSIAFCIAVFLQIMVGAIMRHSYAGLSIPTFPLAFGEIVPPFWNFGIAMHFLHSRIGALLLVLLGGLFVTAVIRSPDQPARVKAAAGLLGFLLILQCVLGMITVWTGKAPLLTTLHLSGGALVFANGILLALAIYRLRAAATPHIGFEDSAQARLSSRPRDGVALT